MIKNFIEELKNAWNKADNALIQLIYINIAIFVLMVVINVVSTIFGLEWLSNFVYRQFSVPPRFGDFLLRPWTMITYAFAHSFDIWHIVFNMLFLYWFGKFIVEYLGNEKLVNLYILGGLAGAALYLLAYNLVNFYIERSYGIDGMIGASGAVYAIVVGAATLLPNHSIHLIFLGPVKIKYIAMFYILLSFLQSTGSNAGGNLAHLGGAGIGYLYITQLQKGNDLGAWIHNVINFFKSFFVKQEPIKVSHRKNSTAKHSVQVEDAQTLPNQDEIDAILDKIAAKGYESLTKEEKQKLFNASK